MDKNINNLISIIIPTYNRSKVIQRSIESVISQTFTNWELLIIDDGGGDDTEEVVKVYQEKFNNIFYYKFPNMGASAARNIGIGLAKGELVGFLDSDDIWTPGRLELINKAYKKDNNTIYVTDFRSNEDKEGRFCKQFLESDNFRQILLSHNFLGGTINLVAPCKILKEVQGFDQQLLSCQDHDIVNRLAEKFPVKYISGEYAIYYRDADNRISSKNKKKLKGHIDYYNKHKSKMEWLTKLLARKKIALIAYNVRSHIFFIYLPFWIMTWGLKKIYGVKDERELYLKMS
jgi:glycosyltransferase involved in cell wall biosynthesis